MPSLIDLPIQLYADGADKAGILELYAKPYIKGLTTNPSLIRKAGVKDYEAFAREILQTVKAKPISFEVFSDEFPEMRRQAAKIKAWAPNVYVKIPISNSRGESAVPLIKELAAEGTKLNITALTLTSQVRDTALALHPDVPAVVSVFSGRLADTGADPIPMVIASAELLQDLPKAELLWASTREVYNIRQAIDCGCKIITVPNDILAKAEKLFGTTAAEVSLDTVKGFAKDAIAAGFKL